MPRLLVGIVSVAAFLFGAADATAEETQTAPTSVRLTSIGIFLSASHFGDPMQVVCLDSGWPIKSSIRLSIDWGWFSGRDYHQEAATSCTSRYSVSIEWDEDRTIQVGEYAVRITDAGWVFGSSQIIEKKIKIDAAALAELRDRGRKDFSIQRGYHLRLMTELSQK